MLPPRSAPTPAPSLSPGTRLSVLQIHHHVFSGKVHKPNHRICSFEVMSWVTQPPSKVPGEAVMPSLLHTSPWPGCRMFF